MMDDDGQKLRHIKTGPSNNRAAMISHQDFFPTFYLSRFYKNSYFLKGKQFAVSCLFTFAVVNFSVSVEKRKHRRAQA